MGMMFSRSFCDTAASMARANPCCAVKTVAGDRMNAGAWPLAPSHGRRAHPAGAGQSTLQRDMSMAPMALTALIMSTAAWRAQRPPAPSPLSASRRPEAFANQVALPEMAVFRPIQANRARWGAVGSHFSGASPMLSPGCAHGAGVPSRTNASDGSSTIPCAAGTLRTSAKATARACTGR